MKKQLTLLSLVILSSSVSMAYEASMEAWYHVATSACGGSQLCEVYSGFTTGVAISPLLLVIGAGDALTKISQANLKLVMDSQEDASYFVASNGENRTAKIEVALQVIRIENPQLQASDLEIAQAIVSL